MDFIVSYKELNSLGLLDEYREYELASKEKRPFEMSERLRKYLERNKVYGDCKGFTDNRNRLGEKPIIGKFG